MPPSPDLIDWLNWNSGAVTGLAAVAGVILAAVYTWLTLQLWRQTKRQAVTTEAALEIGHRPFVAVSVDLGPAGNPRLLPVVLRLRDHGEGPAIITRWVLTVKLGERVVAQRDTAGDNTTLALFPGEEQETPPLAIENEQAVEVWGSREPVRIAAVVHYKSGVNKTYTSRVRARLIRPGGVPPRPTAIATEDQEIT